MRRIGQTWRRVRDGKKQCVLPPRHEGEPHTVKELPENQQSGSSVEEQAEEAQETGQHPDGGFLCSQAIVSTLGFVLCTPGPVLRVGGSTQAPCHVLR